MRPLLSIVIANYNYGRFLSETIESLLSQSCQNFEIIIIDGGSTDNSVEIIKKYAGSLPPGVEREGKCLNDNDKRHSPTPTLHSNSLDSNIQAFKHSNISYWISEPDKGQSNAFNKGFSHAHGRFLTWLNADDVMLPGTIEKLKRAVEQYPECEWFVGGSLWLDPQMNIVNCGRGRPFSELRYREGNVNVWGPSSFFTKRLLDSVGGVDERFQYMMDSDLWLRFAIIGARYRPFCQYAYGLRLHPEAKMSGHNFSEDGTLHLGGTAVAEMSLKKRAQLHQETSWMHLHFKPARSSFVRRLLSVSWLAVLKSRYDLFCFKGQNYQQYFKQSQ